MRHRTVQGRRFYGALGKLVPVLGWPISREYFLGSASNGRSALLGLPNLRRVPGPQGQIQYEGPFPKSCNVQWDV